MAVQWFCRVRGQMRGPLSSQDLKALASSGQLAPDALVRQGAAGAWVKAGRVKGLFATVAGPEPKAASSRPTDELETDDTSDLAGLPGLKTLGNLGELPPVPSAVSSVLPIEQVLETGVPLGELPAVGTAVGSSVFPGATSTHRHVPVRGGPAATLGDEAGRGDWRGMSSVRVFSATLVALVLSFAGLCFVLYPIIPIVLGVAGALIGLRGTLLAGRRQRAALVASAAGIVLGVLAAGWGLHTTLSVDDPRGQLNRLLNGALTGQEREKSDTANPSPANPVRFRAGEIRSEQEDREETPPPDTPPEPTNDDSAARKTIPPKPPTPKPEK